MNAAGRPVRPGERPDRQQLGKFLGMPSDGGLHHAAAATGWAGTSAGSDATPTRICDDVGIMSVATFAVATSTPATGIDRYPAPGIAMAGVDIWAAATWDSMSDWFGYGDTEPIYYDYGNNVTYQDNSVYMNGQDMGTADEYYQQAQTLATTGAQAQTTDDEQWMPLGVFAMTHDDHNKANLILQLAVNKEGIIRGNYTATVTDRHQARPGFRRQEDAASGLDDR